MIIYTKFEVDTTIRCWVTALLMLILYVTLWPWPLKFWPWRVVTHWGSTSPPSLKSLRLSVLELWASEQLVGYFYSAHPLYVAYCLASPDWSCYWQHSMAGHPYQLQPTPAHLTTLMLLIKVSAMVT